MSKANFPGSDKFEPPQYLASLIASVNDGAKTAQAGALLFALVGVYLLATAFSASDEDLLRGRAVTISQLGTSLPVTFSFAIAPFVFVFLHIYTLARYDMLGANVRQFLAELKRTVLLEADRERCRQLLSNVEFVQALVGSRGSPLHSPVWRWLVCAVVAVFPVCVLLLVQINALRYQSALIVLVQRGWLVIDLAALMYFFWRNPLVEFEPYLESRGAKIRRAAYLGSVPAIIMILNWVYLGVVPIDASPNAARYGRVSWFQTAIDAANQPLDSVLCPWLQWGCRFLRVNDRVLVDHVWDGKAIGDLRTIGSEYWKALPAVDGLMLRGRSLRFAVLDGSSLFAADLSLADLTKASLRGASLQGAKLSYAGLLQARLFGAQLQEADLSGARLQGADLQASNLEGAKLPEARLQGALLFRPELRGANLSMAALLHRARLGPAQIRALPAPRRSARLIVGLGTSTTSRLETALGLSDLRDGDFTTPLEFEEREHLIVVHEEVAAQPLQSRTKQRLDRLLTLDALAAQPLENQTKQRLERLLALDVGAAQPQPFDRLLAFLDYQLEVDESARFTASPEEQVLVSNPAMLNGIPKDWLIDKPTPSYTTALTKLLTDLAQGDAAVASGIVSRASRIPEDTAEDRSPYMAVACELIAKVKTGRIRFWPQAPKTDLQELETGCKAN